MRSKIAGILLMAAVGTAQLRAQANGASFYTPIRSNDLSALDTLLKKPGPAARDPRGTTPLMYAAALGSFDAMKKVVDAGTKFAHAAVDLDDI